MLYFFPYNFAFVESGRPFAAFFILCPPSPIYSVKSFRMNELKTPRFTVFCRFFWPRNPFKMNTSRKSPQVFILNDLHDMLSSLESALTKKGGGRWRWASHQFLLSPVQEPQSLLIALKLYWEECPTRLERQTPNAKRQTPNAKRQTPNASGFDC